MKKDFTVKQTKGVLGDKSKTVQLKDKKYKSKANATSFIKKITASKTGRDQSFFVKKSEASTPPKKRKSNSKASAADGKKAKKAKGKKSKKDDRTTQ